jgi:hypothetical protein
MNRLITIAKVTLPAVLFLITFIEVNAQPVENNPAANIKKLQILKPEV